MPASESLLVAAVAIGFVHTIVGPDHYLPFVAMSRAGGWPLGKTVIVTLLCGMGHVLASVVLGFVGIGLGMGVERLEHIESTRAEWATWLLIGFGLAYLVWGIRRAIRNRPHTHLHGHADGTWHRHDHVHDGEHLHVHAAGHLPPAQGSAIERRHGSSLTPWILFTIFLFGPCEALIPLLMFPAAQGSMMGVVWVTLLFGAATLLTMTAIVVAVCLGLDRLRLPGLARARLPGLQRFHHAMAGAVVLGCGLAVKFGL